MVSSSQKPERSGAERSGEEEVSEVGKDLFLEEARKFTSKRDAKKLFLDSEEPHPPNMDSALQKIQKNLEAQDISISTLKAQLQEQNEKRPVVPVEVEHRLKRFESSLAFYRG